MSLPQYDAKQIDKYRDAAVDYGWSLFIESDFRTEMANKGIYVDHIYYDLSYCQGSGACFSGTVCDWGKYLLHLGYDNRILADAAMSWRVHWSHKGRYCHENSVTFNMDMVADLNPYDELEDTLRFDMWNNVLSQFDLSKLAIEIQEDLRGHMKRLYRTLITEYEDLTSDESVSDWMQHNGIELTELEN